MDLRPVISIMGRKRLFPTCDQVYPGISFVIDILDMAGCREIVYAAMQSRQTGGRILYGIMGLIRKNIITVRDTRLEI